jgi:hypothetical protein
MKYTIRLEKQDTEGVRNTVSEAYRSGQEVANLGSEAGPEPHAYFKRLLNQIESQAEFIAEKAFAMGVESARLKTEH